jgi:heat shock protein HslJ
MRRFVALVVVVAAALVGCDALVPAPSGLSLDGTSWRALSVDGAAPIAGHDITLKIEGTTVSGTTGCNSWGGALVEQEGGLVLRPESMTAAACVDPAPARMEQRVTGILFEEPRVELLPDHLAVRTPAGEILYGPVSRPSAAPTDEANRSRVRWTAAMLPLRS